MDVTKFSEMTDGELVRILRDHPENARWKAHVIEILYTRYEKQVRNRVDAYISQRNITLGSAMKEEISGRAWVKITEQLPRIRNEKESLAGWVNQVVDCAAVDEVRSRLKGAKQHGKGGDGDHGPGGDSREGYPTPGLVFLPPDELPESESAESLHGEYEDNEMRRKVRELIFDRLAKGTPNGLMYARILWARGAESSSWEDIGKEMGKSISTVQRMHKEALRKARLLMEEQGMGDYLVKGP